MYSGLEQYKKAFGIETSLSVFPPKELKRRWRILCKKYHPDHGGREKHFAFVQEAYQALKREQENLIKLGKLKEVKEKNEINEIIINLKGGGYAYIWDIGESNFKKRYEWEKTHGVNLNKYY